MNESSSNPNQSFDDQLLRSHLDSHLDNASTSDSGNLISGGNQISSKSHWLLIALLLVLAAGLGGWLAWRYLPAGVVPPPSDVLAPVEDTNIEPLAPAAPINGSEIDTSDWQTYRNEDIRGVIGAEKFRASLFSVNRQGVNVEVSLNVKDLKLESAITLVY